MTTTQEEMLKLEESLTKDIFEQKGNTRGRVRTELTSARGHLRIARDMLRAAIREEVKAVEFEAKVKEREKAIALEAEVKEREE